MNTRHVPFPVQSNGSQPPSSGRVGTRSRTDGDDGAADHGLTRHVMVLVVETAVTVALSGCGLRLEKGSPTSLPSAPASETARDRLARQAALISPTAGVVAQAGGGDATATGLAEGVKQMADAQLETLDGVWQLWPSQVLSAYPTVAPAPSVSTGASAQNLAAVLAGGSTLARHTATAAASEQDAWLFTSLAVAWSLQHDSFQPPDSTDKSWVEVAQGSKISSDPLISYDMTRYAVEGLAVRSDDSQRTWAITDVKAVTSAVSAAATAGSGDKRLGAYAAPSKSIDPSASTQMLQIRQMQSAIMSSEVQGAGSAKASSPAREAAVTDAIDAARHATT